MPSTTGYKRGDVVLISFPFTDLTSTKRRPALIVSPDSFNKLQQDLILAAITSQISEDEIAIVLADQDFQEGELPRKSMVKLTKLFTIHSELVVKRVCTLSEKKMAEVLQKLRDFYS